MGQPTRYKYDALGRMMKTTDATTGWASEQTYDTGGNRTGLTLCGPASGCRLQRRYEYDGLRL